MTAPVPYDKYEKGVVRTLLDSLPLSVEGMRIAPGMIVSFIVRFESHTRNESIDSSRVLGVTRDKVYFELGISKMNCIKDGIQASRCYIDDALCREEFAKKTVTMDQTA